jgi:hypothetical protein
MRSRPLALLLALSALATACDSPSGSGVQVPANLELLSGNDQQAVVGTQLPNPLVVRVTDEKGKAIEGLVVNFRVTSGGGSVFAGSAATNADGQAQERWTLGTSTADSQRVEVRAVDAVTGQALVFATFRATALADAPNAVAAVGAAVRAGNAGAPLADSLAAKVTDRYGNGVPGTTVVWSVTRGGGTVSPAQSTTDAQGVARTLWTLGTRLDSVQVAEAAISPVTRVVFSATAGLPLGAQLTKVSGDGQNGTVGSELGAPLVVRLALADGRPVVGATIVWAIASGGGAVTPPTSVTDADGRAQTTWRLGTASGQQGVAAHVESLTVWFTANGAPGAPATFAKMGGDGQTGAAGSAAADSLAVQVRDAHGNPVPGATVTWSVVKGGGSVSAAQTAPDANGMAKVRWTLGLRVDSVQSVIAQVTPALRLQFNAQAGIPSTASLVAVSGNGQTGEVGTELDDPVVVMLRLPDGRGIIGAPVTFSAPPTSGTLAPATVATDADGRASATWTLGTVAGAATGSAGAPGVASLPLAATARPGAAAALQKVSGDGLRGAPGEAMADSLIVRAVDRFGNPVPGVTITWSAASGSVSPATMVTRADGTARTLYTLPTAAGAHQVQASAPGVTPVTFTLYTNAAPVFMRILQPTANAVYGDSVPVRVVVDSANAPIQSVQALAAGRSVTLVPSGGALVGTLRLGGAPWGPTEVRVRATTVNGDTAVVSVTIQKDEPPRIVVTAPVRGTVARPEIRLDADCVDDNPAGCTSIVANVKYNDPLGAGTNVATGTTGIHTTVSLAGWTGDLLMRYIARDSRGQQTLWAEEIYAEPSAALTEVGSGGSRMWDVDASGRLLFSDTAGNLFLRSGGSNVLLMAGVRPSVARLHPQGAIFRGTGAYDWRNGTLVDLGASTGVGSIVAGDWGVIFQGGTMYRRNLATGTNTAVTTSSVAAGYDVAPDGDVVYATSPVQGASDVYDVYRFDGTGTTRLTSDPDATMLNLGPVTDGTNVLYRKIPPGGSTPGHIALWRSGVETILTTSASLLAREYEASGGWIAWQDTDGGGVVRVYTRSPDGTTRLATSTTASSNSSNSIRALLPDGALIYAHGGRTYAIRPPYTGSPLQVANDWSGSGRWAVVGNEVYLLLGRSAFRVNF